MASDCTEPYCDYDPKADGQHHHLARIVDPDWGNLGHSTIPADVILDLGDAIEGSIPSDWWRSENFPVPGDPMKDLLNAKRLMESLPPTPTVSISEGQSEWFKDAIGATTESKTLSFDVTGANIGALFGIPVIEDPELPRHSVTIDTVERVPAEPKAPARVFEARWWQWRKKAAELDAWTEARWAYREAYAAWVAEGRPEFREVLVRRFFPSVRIGNVDG